LAQLMASTKSSNIFVFIFKVRLNEFIKRIRVS